MTLWVVTQVAVAPFGSAEVTPLKPPGKAEGQKAEWSVHSIASIGNGQLAVVWVSKGGG